jgi:PhnB protein
MSIQTATPYLILSGHAQRAIALYTRALGARTETLQRFGDVEQSCPAARRELVMHAALRIGNALMMLSDGPEEAAQPAGRGAVSVAPDFEDEAELRRVFDGLVATGKPVMPVFDAPWGAVFGVVEDELGISWMLNCSKPPAGRAPSAA